MPNWLSKQTLFRLRNDIPIDFVIAQILRIPSKITEGYLRFLCPLCNEFDSAINPNTNLARCFICQKNFNPIDLVMADSEVSFRDAVKVLIPHLPATPSDPSSRSKVAPTQTISTGMVAPACDSNPRQTPHRGVDRAATI